MVGTELEFWQQVYDTVVGIIIEADQNKRDFSPKTVSKASAKFADLAIIERRKREKNGLQISDNKSD